MQRPNRFKFLQILVQSAAVDCENSISDNFLGLLLWLY
jgi:hypothetical protein